MRLAADEPQEDVLEGRALTLEDLTAADALAPVPVDGPGDASLFIRREPLGVVLAIPAWNYPYLIAVNSVLPALIAGNAVVLKHSSQTPLCGERLAAIASCDARPMLSALRRLRCLCGSKSFTSAPM